ncbi:lyase family protein [Rhizomonospora bruguierae]|uniref:lyase family protein n=1 Tax=Rhizomonospora bruguierae TaxID=1581705 RepID=UPI001BD09746|nr:lyase family protein [Micromonospora sp. NBRC 107566]
MNTDRRGFDLLTALAGDPATAGIFAERSMVDAFLRVEVALAAAEADVDLITSGDAEAIAAAARVEHIDLDRLWADTRNVGYPILPLVRQLDALLPEKHRGTAHLGATTQDIMDSGLALQLVAACDRLDQLLAIAGGALAAAAAEHVDTVLAARTHGQQAVPTTWGAKLAGYLGEFTRHRSRLGRARHGVGYVSLFGAGGTSAAYGPRIDEIRTGVARRLRLRVEVVPRHVARDALVEWGTTVAAITGTCARLGREVVNLSRNEISEVTERAGHHRGASSTMPQKANPISSEILVGLATVSGALASALLRTMEAGHDRAAGEWQAEWQVFPQLAGNAAAAVSTAGELLGGLRVDADRMRANLALDHGLVMAEAYMIKLAPALGRENAHDVVYAAVRAARSTGVTLFEAVREALPEQHRALLTAPLSPDSYLGETARLVEVAVARWHFGRDDEEVS